MKKSAGIPLLIIAAILPLIVYFHIEVTDFAKYPWFPNQNQWMDLFLYGKSMLLQGMCFLMTLILIKRALKSKSNVLSRDKRLILLLLLLIILSAVFSEFPKESFSGSIEQYESVWVLCAYVVTGVFSYYYSKEEKNRRLLIRALKTGLALSCVLGILQFFQHDFWNSEIGKRILVPEAFSQLRDSLRFAQDYRGFGRVYMGLYNPSYAGIYLVMLLPFLIFEKGKFNKILLIPAVLCLLGTMSKTAWFVLAILLTAGCWLLKKPEKIFGNYRKGRLTLGITSIVLCLALGGVLLTEKAVLREENRLQEIVPEEEHIRVVYEGNTLYMSEFPKDEGVTYRIVDEDGNEPMLLWVPERGEMVSQDSRFDDLHFKVYQKDGIGYIYVKYAEVVFRFTDQTGTGKYEYISSYGKIDELKDAQTLFRGGDSLLNGRGYIWNRTLPLIFDHILIGSGPDTFLQVFPQDDYVARANLGYGFFSELLTNAHSFYMQLGVQNGILAVLIFLILMGKYIGRTWKYYRKRKEYDGKDCTGLACLLGTAGYLFCGIVFSSSVCTTPFFAIIAGMGAAISKDISVIEKNKEKV